jgi:hypothetical protein
MTSEKIGGGQIFPEAKAPRRPDGRLKQLRQRKRRKPKPRRTLSGLRKRQLRQKRKGAERPRKNSALDCGAIHRIRPTIHTRRGLKVNMGDVLFDTVK